MKIAVDAHMLGSGGIGTYIASLLPYFLEKNECFIFGDGSAISPFGKYENAETAECRVKTFSLAERFAFPRELCKKINSCDVYYTPYCNIPSGIKIPVFSTIHDVVFLDVPGLASKAGVAARKYFYQRAIDRSRAVFTVSEFSQNRIRATLDCKNLPIVVTYSAIPTWFSSKTPQVVHRIRQLLFVGNIKKHKGLSVLLSALKKARKKGFDMPLVIAGNADIDLRPYDAYNLQKELWQFAMLKKIGIKLEEADFQGIKAVIQNVSDSPSLAAARREAKEEAWMYEGKAGANIADFMIETVNAFKAAV